MTIQTLEIILWAIPISILLIIVVWISLDFKKERKPLIKTWLCGVLPEILKCIMWILLYIGAMVGCVYLWGEATKQFGILGFIGFIVLLNYFSSSKTRKPNK